MADVTDITPKQPTTKTGNVGSTGNMSTVTVTGTQPGSLQDFLNKSNALSRATFWQRAGILALGIALIWVGILILIASNKTVQNVTKTAIGGAIAKTPAGVATNLATGALA